MVFSTHDRKDHVYFRCQRLWVGGFYSCVSSFIGAVAGFSVVKACALFSFLVKEWFYSTKIVTNGLLCGSVLFISCFVSFIYFLFLICWEDRTFF